MLRPLVVLVDVSARDELATVLAITTEFPEVRVVALFVHECEDDVLACAANGAAGYVPSEGSLEDVTRVVECVARGEAVLSPRMAACLFKRVGETRAPASDAVATSALTHRESEVVALVAEGLSNKEIAARLSVAVPTIKNHVHSILRKLNVDRRAKIAAQSRPSPASWTPIRRAGPAADAESGRRRVRRFTTARAP
jgi:DNA-binding NarL/FixJ family response regulator